MTEIKGFTVSASSLITDIIMILDYLNEKHLKI